MRNGAFSITLFVAILSAATIVLCTGLREIDGPDIFFHIALGRALLSGQWEPDLAALYFTPTSDNWKTDFRTTFGGDFLFALIDGSFGLAGVQVFCFVIFAATGGLFFWQYRQTNGSRFQSSQGVLVCLCLAAYGVGTIHLQSPRNAVFSLFLIPVVLILSDRFLERGTWRHIAVLVVVFATWLLLHASYLLGFALITAQAVGYVLDRSRTRERTRATLARPAVLILILLALCAPLSSTFRHYFTLPLHRLSEALGTTTSIRQPSQEGGRPKPPRSFPPAIGMIQVQDGGSNSGENESGQSWSISGPVTQKKESTLLTALISPLWKNSESDLVSGDFLPSWKSLRYLPLLVALTLGGIVVLMTFAIGAEKKLSRLLPLLVTFYFAICYVRGSGYLTLVSIWCLAIFDFPFQQARKRVGSFEIAIAAVLAVTALVFTISAASGSLGAVLGENTHTFGLGPSPMTDQRICRFISDNYPDDRPFTTILSGSFALYEWQKKKKPVFIDAFFPAHASEVWEAYIDMAETCSLGPVTRTFMVDSALIENCRFDWQELIWDDDEFYPVVLGEGMTYYRRASGSPPICHILFDEQELSQIRNVVTRYNAAAQVLNIAYLLEIRGHSAEAARYRDRYSTIIDAAKKIVRHGAKPTSKTAEFFTLYR